MVDQATPDAATLVAVTAFLRDCELSIDCLTQDDSSPSWSPAAENGKARGFERRDQYRRKVENERQMLQRQQRELSRMLKRLQDARSREKQQEKESYTMALSVWRSSVLRQQELRSQAEEQQQRLKSAVLRQQELIWGMNALLSQQRLGSSLVGTVSSGMNTGLLFKTFVDELDSLHAQIDAVLSNAEVKVLQPESFAAKRGWTQDGDLLTRADETELPFDVEQISLAMTLTFLSDPDGSHYRGEIENPENTAAITYRQNFTLESGDSATLVVYTVVRRYVEADRVVFIWRVLSEGQGEFDGLYADERAWIVIRPSTKGENSLASPVTAMESYTRLKPVHLNGQPVSSDPRGKRFIKLLVMVNEEDPVLRK